MTLTAHLSYFLVLLLAGQGLSDSLLTKDAGPRPLELKEVFKLFQIRFNRSYWNPAEYTRRLSIFAHNLAQAQRLQQEDLGTAEFGETPFSDLTEEEFGQLYGQERSPERTPNMTKKVESNTWGESVPRTCDWRKAKNIISSVKNQESCKCCWAMAAADNIQALWRIVIRPVLTTGQEEHHRPKSSAAKLYCLHLQEQECKEARAREKRNPFPIKENNPSPRTCHSLIGCSPSAELTSRGRQSTWSGEPPSAHAQIICLPPRTQLSAPSCNGECGCGFPQRIKHQQLVDVSVQELLDCERCGNGCNGGFVWDAYLTVLNNSGLASEKDYPFQGDRKPHRCLAKKYKKVAWIQDFTMLSNNEQAIARYLAMHGPITVTINMKLLQHYQKGVIKATPSSCDPRRVDHSVLLVGFGKEKEGMQTGTVLSHSRKRRHSSPYWILKNSWGAQWGEKGYFRLYRGNNTCGITKYPFTAQVGSPVKKARISCPP